jgi:glycosyltransferase involved in cell wall biosynthesis
MDAVHLVEPGGRGGVYQHTVQVAIELAEAGFDVVVHTSADAEALSAGNVRSCRCFSWCRTIPHRRLRLIAVISRFVLRTLPHLIYTTRRGFVHVQGQFAEGLFALCIGALSRTADVCVFSPHNTFSRSGSRTQRVALRHAVQRADICVCFAPSDEARLRELGARRVEMAPLVQFAPHVPDALIAEWRSRLADDGTPLVVLAGQIRPDKGVDDFLIASTLVPPGRAAFAVVGEDAGYAARAIELRDRLVAPVTILVDYFDLVDFVAILRAADVVTAPYKQASSSGVIALASQVGTPSVAYPVGGLRSSGALLTEDPSAQGLANAVMDVLGRHGALTRQANCSNWIGRIYQGAGGSPE